MFKKYLLYLYKQYCDANGLEFDFFKFESLSKDFIKWLAVNKALSEEYRDYLYYLGYVRNEEAYEVDKGRYDSIAKDNIEMLSMFADTLNLENRELIVIGNMPLIETRGKLEFLDKKIILFHNPYDEVKPKLFTGVYNTQKHIISVGVYGRISDSDFVRKVDFIERLGRITDNSVVDYDTDRDKYFCTLNIKQKIRVREIKI